MEKTIEKPMNQAMLKYIVIVLMLLDHIAGGFLTSADVLYLPFRFISRLTAPTMAYFIAQGYQYTKNVKKYLLRLGIFAIISSFAFTLYENGVLCPVQIVSGNTVPDDSRAWLYISSLNKTVVCFSTSVIFTLFLGLLSILIWDKGNAHTAVKIILTVVICYIAGFGDWKYWDVLFCLNFYFLRNNKNRMWAVYSIIAVMYVFNFCLANNFAPGINVGFYLYRTGVFLVIPFIELLYNGKAGKKSAFNKWFFYIFYPGHLLALYAVKQLVG